MRRSTVSHSLITGLTRLTRLSAATTVAMAAAAAAHADPVVVSGPSPFAACTIGGPGTT